MCLLMPVTAKKQAEACLQDSQSAKPGLARSTMLIRAASLETVLYVVGIGNYLSKNITAYYDTAVKLAWQLNAPGTPAESLISRNVGSKVSTPQLPVHLGLTAC